MNINIDHNKNKITFIPENKMDAYNIGRLSMNVPMEIHPGINVSDKKCMLEKAYLDLDCFYEWLFFHKNERRDY